MWFYIFLVILILLLSKAYSNNMGNHYGYIMLSIVLTIVGTIRFDVGWDYESYYTTIDNCSVFALSRFEPLSLLICLLAIYWDNTFIFFVVSSLIIYPLAFIAFKRNSISAVFSLIIYIGIFYLSSFSIVRQALAVSVCLYAYKYLKEQSFKRFFFCIIIATLFHYSAIVSLIVYPIYKVGKVKLTVFLCLFVLLGKNLIFYILASYGLYTNYLSQLEDMEGGNWVHIFYILLFCSLFVLKKKYSTEDRKHLAIIVPGLLTSFIFGNSIGGRLGYYFVIYFCYTIPFLLNNQNLFVRKCYITFFCFYFLLMIYFTSNISGQKSAYTPYRTIFTIDKIDFKD